MPGLLLLCLYNCLFCTWPITFVFLCCAVIQPGGSCQTPMPCCELSSQKNSESNKPLFLINYHNLKCFVPAIETINRWLRHLAKSSELQPNVTSWKKPPWPCRLGQCLIICSLRNMSLFFPSPLCQASNYNKKHVITIIQSSSQKSKCYGLRLCVCFWFKKACQGHI